MTKDELLQRIGQNIRKYRDENHLTQNQLAEKIGISTPFLANLERGKKGMSLLVLLKVADGLSVSADYLLRDDSPDIRLDNINALLKDKPNSFIVAMEKMVRLCIDEFALNDEVDESNLH